MWSLLFWRVVNTTCPLQAIPIISQTRYLEKKGELQEMSKGATLFNMRAKFTPVYFFLFNDLLVIAAKKGLSSKTKLTRHKMLLICWPIVDALLILSVRFWLEFKVYTEFFRCCTHQQSNAFTVPSQLNKCIFLLLWQQLHKFAWCQWISKLICKLEIFTSLSFMH